MSKLRIYLYNYLHLYFSGSQLPKAKDAAELINTLNKNCKSEQKHIALESFFSARVFISIVKDWILLAVKTLFFSPKKFSKSEELLTWDLWPFFRDYWHSSVRGSESMNALIYLNLFEKAFSEQRVQRLGVYLQENYVWEYAMLSAWRSQGNARIIGYPHNTVRFWDMRYFFHPLTYESGSFPRPDKVAVNGKAAFFMFSDSGYPIEDLVHVEALRFLHLGNDSKANDKTSRQELKVVENPTLLVLGDGWKRLFDHQMIILEKAMNIVGKKMQVILKPHPIYEIGADNYPSLDISVSKKPIKELLEIADIVFTGAMTASAIDAYCTGLPVVISYPGDTFNMSPLRGVPDAHFVNSGDDLADIIIKLKLRPGSMLETDDIFNLDIDLPEWKNLLQL